MRCRCLGKMGLKCGGKMGLGCDIEDVCVCVRERERERERVFPKFQTKY